MFNILCLVHLKYLQIKYYKNKNDLRTKTGFTVLSASVYATKTIL